MLNESKTRLPSLIRLCIDYDQLKTVTNNFTRDSTRLDCIHVEQVDFQGSINDDDDYDSDWIKAQPNDFHAYFPLLKL
jgi:hypothetical protein